MYSRKWQGTASGILIGLGVGVGIGVLLAPRSGKEMRDQIAGSVKDGPDSAVAKGQDLTRLAQKSLEEARDRLRDAADAGEQAYKDARSAVS